MNSPYFRSLFFIMRHVQGPKTIVNYAGKHPLLINLSAFLPRYLLFWQMSEKLLSIAIMLSISLADIKKRKKLDFLSGCLSLIICQTWNGFSRWPLPSFQRPPTWTKSWVLNTVRCRPGSWLLSKKHSLCVLRIVYTYMPIQTYV